MQSFETRLWSKIDIRGETECWPWLAGKHKGYGRLRKFVDGKWMHISAAKAVWEDFHGPMPAGHEPEHTCNDPGCCNPLHIEATTHSENMKRMWQRGRAKPGKRTSQFSEAQLKAIATDPRSSRVIGRAYGIDHSTVVRIRAKHR